jgi:hypothetical protein
MRMQMAVEIKEIKKEIQSLKEIVLSGKDALIEKRLVSLRGMGRFSVSENELYSSVGVRN